MTEDELQTHYKIVMSTLKLERGIRMLRHEDVAMARLDRSIASMRAIGDVLLRAKQTGLLPSLLSDRDE